MKTQSTENAYLIEDVNSFCSSVQVLDPDPESQTVSIKELSNNYCDSVVKKIRSTNRH